MTFDEEMEALKAREAEAEAALAPHEAARAQRAELAAYRRTVEAKERAIKDAPEIERAEAEHGPIGEKIAVIETDMGAIVIKRPEPAVFKRFQDKGATKTDDLLALVKPCLVYPDAKRLGTILDALPATLSRLADEAVTLAGLRAKEVSGK